MSVYDIVVDSNEAWQHQGKVNALIKAGYRVKIERLEAGDWFFVGENRSMLVEVKTSKDFAKSVVDGRLWDQLRRMKMKKEQIGCDIVLLIEGTWYQVVKYTKWNRTSIIGIIDSVRDPDGWGVEIFGPLPSKIWTIMWFKRRAKKGKGIPKKTLYALRRKLKDTTSPDEKKRYIVEGLAGFGPKTSDLLLKEFGSVKNLFNNIEKIDKIKGIGPNLRKTATEVVTGLYLSKP